MGNGRQFLVFTSAAAKKVAELIAEEGNPELMLRIYVVAAARVFNTIHLTKQSAKVTSRW